MACRFVQSPMAEATPLARVVFVGADSTQSWVKPEQVSGEIVSAGDVGHGDGRRGRWRAHEDVLPHLENTVVTFAPSEAVEVSSMGSVDPLVEIVRVLDNFGRELVAAVVHLRS